jgi:hypothetical protein
MGVFSALTSALLLLVVLLAAIKRLLERSRMTALAGRLADSRQILSHDEIRELILKHGNHSNSFLSLYDGFLFFTFPDGDSRKGVIPFVERRHVRVGACDPLAQPEDRIALMDQFVKEAALLGKTAVILPISPELAELARKQGLNCVMIGSEPMFELSEYPPTGRTWTSLVSTAKTVQARGAEVVEFDPEKLSASERENLDSIVAEWLGSRKMDALGFLNQVEPWKFSRDKKYFQLSLEGENLAFIAAVPIWGREGWYLIDVMRRQHTPSGTTELLIIEAMRLLKEQGFKLISLGVAPLADMENAPRSDGNERLYRIFRFLYLKGGSFYNFESLHRFKLKFIPSKSVPSFLMLSGRLGIRDYLEIFDVFLPGGLRRAIWSTTIRAYAQFSLTQWIRAQLGPKFVVLSAPPDLSRLFLRCRLATLLVLLNFAGIVMGFGSVAAIPLLVLGIGGVEYLAGSFAALLCFLVPGMVLGTDLLHADGGFSFLVLGGIGGLGGLSLILRRGWILCFPVVIFGAVSAYHREPAFWLVPVAYGLGTLSLIAYFRIRTWQQ